MPVSSVTIGRTHVIANCPNDFGKMAVHQFR